MAIYHDLIARFMQWGAGEMMKVPLELQHKNYYQPTPQKIQIPTRFGDVTAYVYWPVYVARIPPVYVNFHGGGYVFRCPEYDEHICRYLGEKVGCAVINVDYDVAPQKRFPVPTNQAYDICKWVGDPTKDHDWDVENLAVGGQSAGGSLAVAVCLSAQSIEQCAPKQAKLIKALIVNYAPLDISIPPQQKTALAKKPVITPSLASVFNAAYTPKIADRLDPQASPLRAETFEGFPPTLVVSAELDLLCAENDRLAARMKEDGVTVTHHTAKNVDHGFTHYLPVEPVFETLELMVAHLNQNINGKTDAV